MIRISVEEDIRQRCPEFIGAALFIDMVNSEHSDELWDEIIEFEERYRKEFDTESLKEHPAILSTREAYKRCGKDPSRYRPSGEALIRRMLKGNSLYQVNTAVDLINLASIRFGYSIGGFDQDKIEGENVILGIGREGEPYEGIGRGVLNIDGMPVYRDRLGGIGTPTSDNERTKLSLETTRLLCIVNGYDGNKDNVLECARFISELTTRYCQGKEIDLITF